MHLEVKFFDALPLELIDTHVGEVVIFGQIYLQRILQEIRQVPQVNHQGRI